MSPSSKNAFITIIMLFSLLLRVNLTAKEKTIDLSELEENIIGVITKGYTRNTTFYAYVDQKNGDIYFPLMDFMNELGVAMEWQSLYKGSGWFIKREHKVVIDLTKNFVFVSGKRFTLSATDMAEYQGVIYFKGDLLNKLFDISTNYDPNNLELNINSTYTLPIEVEGNKDKNRASAEKNKEHITLSEPKKYYLNNDFFSVPVLDLLYNYGYSVSINNDNKRDKNSRNALSLSYGGIVASLDSKIVLISEERRVGRSNDINMVFSKTYPLEKKYGISNFSFGDVQSVNSILLSDNKSGRGFFLSSSNTYQTNKNRTITIEGVLVPGWEVELYYGDQIVGFVQDSRVNNYKFDNISVNPGTNTFKLVFYGPFGEVREEEKTFIIGATPVAAGKIGFEVSAVQQNRKFMETPSRKIQHRAENKSDFFDTNINLHYGITDNLAITNSLSLQENNYLEKEKALFYGVGATYNWNKIVFESNIAFKQGYSALAYQSSVFGNIKYLGNIYASYSDFNGVKSDASSHNLRYMKNSLELRSNSYIPLVKFNLPFYVSYIGREFASSGLLKSSYQSEYIIRTNFNLFAKYFITLEDSISVRESYRENYIRTFFSTSYKYFGFRGDSEYMVLPSSELRKAGMTLDIKPFDSTFYTYIQYNRYFRRNGKDYNYVRASIAKGTKIGNFELSLGNNIERSYDISISYGISFGYDSINRRLLTEGEYTLANSGNLIAKIFIDNNANNKHDEKEPILENAKISINKLDYKRATNKNGSIYVTNQQKYEKLDITVNAESLDNMALHPRSTEYNIILRPGVNQKLLIPMLQTGDLDGVVYSTTKDSYAYSFITLIPLNKNNPTLKEQSDRQGAYYFSAVPYGDYKVLIQDLYSSNQPYEAGIITINNNIISKVDNIKVTTPLIKKEKQ